MGRGGGEAAGRRAGRERRPSCSSAWKWSRGSRRQLLPAFLPVLLPACHLLPAGPPVPQLPGHSREGAGWPQGQHRTCRDPQSRMHAPAWCPSVQHPRPDVLRTSQLAAMASPATASSVIGDWLCEPLPSASLRTTLPALPVPTKPTSFPYTGFQQQDPLPGTGCLSGCWCCCLGNRALQGSCCRCSPAHGQPPAQPYRGAIQSLG